MIKLAIYAAIALAILGSIYAGVDHVRDTFAERDRLVAEVAGLKQTVEDQLKAIAAVQVERDDARKETLAANEAAATERKLRDDIAIESARVARIHRESLDNALAKIRSLGRASPDADRCMLLPVPDGLLELSAAETGPTTEVSGYREDATGGVPAGGADPGPAKAPTVGDALILGQHMRTALLNCNGKLASARAWGEAQRVTP